MIDISIILPVYNSEKTIGKVLESVINQTFKNWELLVIDDGSTDYTYAICKKYSCQDKRIKVLQKTNGGVSSARQMGIENAVGTYSMHVDSDDWFECNMLQAMYEKITCDNSDIVITDFYEHLSMGRCVRKNQNISDLSSIEVLFGILSGKYFGALWNKMVRHSLYKECDAHFFQGLNYMEDVLIWIQILRCPTIKISYLPEAFYHYCVNDNSITQHISRDTFDGIVRMHEKIKCLLPDIDNRFVEYKESLCIGDFQAGFLNKLFTDTETKMYYNRMRHMAYKNPSLRWKIGYFLIQIGAYRLAYHLLHKK